MPRHWTPADDAAIAAEYPSATLKQLAARFGCSVAAVGNRARRLNLVKVPRVGWTAEADGTIRRMHAAGHPDTDIAAVLSVSYRTVTDRRARLGLKAFYSERKYEATVAANRLHLERAGVKSLAELKRRAHVRYAAGVVPPSAASSLATTYGLPPELSLREVQILVALLFHGPATRRAIAERIGATVHRNQRKLLAGSGPGGTYTAKLIARGLVCYAARGGGRDVGRRPGMYMLTTAALSTLAAHDQEDADGR